MKLEELRKKAPVQSKLIYANFNCFFTVAPPLLHWLGCGIKSASQTWIAMCPVGLYIQMIVS